MTERSQQAAYVQPGEIGIPSRWLNIAASIPFELPRPKNPDRSPASRASLGKIYADECAGIEFLDGRYESEKCIDIPDKVLAEYAKYRPTPLRRAYGLEQVLGYAGQIFYKREDLNPTGSHKPNTAIPQAYYAACQGLNELVTDTGAGQWGSALAWACREYGIDCTVFMTRNSFTSKPGRVSMMRLCNARVEASPSSLTECGRRFMDEDPNHRGSLGIAMGEAMEYIATHAHARLALGCMAYYATMHQTIIGQELDQQLSQAGIQPDLMIGCVGGGTNFVGFVSVEAIKAANTNRRSGVGGPRLLAVESANVPVLTKGRYEWENADYFGYAPCVKMYTLGRESIPPDLHAGGLRYHGKAPILSLLYHHGIVEAAAVDQSAAFAAGKQFFESEGVLVAPETGHAIAQVMEEVRVAKERDETPTIVFCLSGTGYLDLAGYEELSRSQ